ncbi:serine/threonine-protein kinase PknD [Mycobacterium asiaticum]|nr:serine/threonine-protein kinase PknD [Mycobacterium asiaticum]
MSSEEASLETGVDGEIFGRYRLLEVLRWGGLGTVYRARDTMMTREVAIKVLPTEQAGEAQSDEQFRHEASIAAQLNNPNIIPIYEAGEIEGQRYLVMPLLDGLDAGSLLRRDGAMHPTLAVRVIEQAAAALDAMHSAGLVHADVKPSNLFVVGGEFVYLIDFGVASQTPAVDQVDDDARQSWAYLAPERIKSEPPDVRADTYALAAVLYECLTGRPPVAGDSLEQVVAARLEDGPPKPTEVNPAVPVGFDEVIARGMATNPDERYQSSRELAGAARNALASNTIAPAGSLSEVEFGRYRLFEMLGSGGMGSVYRAHDTALGRDVAVKVLRPELATEPGYQERFRREAYAAGRLSSPNIIPIYEAGEIDGRLYLVMPVVDGVDVHTVLQREGPMSPAKAVRVIEQVAAALDTAHRAELVHRDVKPSNILMVGDDFVYLIDFGLVHEASAARLTLTNVTPGTPGYMAPERFTGEGTADARADVYSLACVLYECLTAKLPFSGGGIEGLAVAHLRDEPPRPSEAQPAIPVKFDEVIARGMAKNPDDRYQSASELAAAARAALTAAGPRHAKPTPGTGPADSTQDAAVLAPVESPRRSRRPLVLGLAAVVTVALAVTAIMLLDNPFRSAPDSAQTVLPFQGLDGPVGVAVDANGTVYVTDSGHNRVVQLAAGATNQTVAPFTDLNHPTAIAVDGQGDMVVAEAANSRVLELPAGSTSPTVLPFTDLTEPTGIAVYARGADRIYYVADSLHNRVLTLQPTGQTELPFTGLEHPSAVVVDKDGVLFVVDRDNERILRLPPTAIVATVLPYAVDRPDFMTVGEGDDLYVSDGHANKVVKLVKASNTSDPLPFQGLKNPQGIAVDAAGNVYVVDSGNNRVLKLPPS